MTDTLIASRTPGHLLANLKAYLLSDGSTALTGPVTVSADGSDPTGVGLPEETVRAVSLAVDYQQPASPRSLYARLMVRCYVCLPDGATDYDALYTLAGDVAENLRRYPATHGDVISCTTDSGPSVLFDGTRACAYQTLLLQIPTHE